MMSHHVFGICLAALGLLGSLLAGASPVRAQDDAVWVCSADPDWVRPTTDEMAITTWRDNRYGSSATGEPNRTASAYYAGHFFVFSTPTASGVSHMLDMTGLTPFTGDMCGAAGGDGADELIAGQTLVVFAIGFRVQGAAVEGDDLVVDVELSPTGSDSGYQVVQLSRPGTPEWRAQFVLDDGRTVACANGHEILASEDTDFCAGRTE